MRPAEAPAAHAPTCPLMKRWEHAAPCSLGKDRKPPPTLDPLQPLYQLPREVSGSKEPSLPLQLLKKPPWDRRVTQVQHQHLTVFQREGGFSLLKPQNWGVVLGREGACGRRRTGNTGRAPKCWCGGTGDLAVPEPDRRHGGIPCV